MKKIFSIIYLVLFWEIFLFSQERIEYVISRGENIEKNIFNSKATVEFSENGIIKRFTLEIINTAYNYGYEIKK